MPNKLLHNAEIVLKASCRAQEGETLLLVTERSEKMMGYAQVLAAAGEKLGLVPMIIDISEFSKSAHNPKDTWFREGLVFPPLKAALEASDIAIVVSGSFRYGELVGDMKVNDSALTADRRWMYLQSNGMEEWNITEKEVIAIRKRTYWVIDKLREAKECRITCPLGTDFRFSVTDTTPCTPILGIIPLYGEVAVIPDPGMGEGVYVVAGATQRKVRTLEELDREPLRFTVENGIIKDVTGDPEQLQRLEVFMSEEEPRADQLDEIGIVTTSIIDNDVYWWASGTHNHDTTHIAIGNNPDKVNLVHGMQHMDGEVLKPSIELDGTCIFKDGLFIDEVMG